MEQESQAAAPARTNSSAPNADIRTEALGYVRDYVARTLNKS